MDISCNIKDKFKITKKIITFLLLLCFIIPSCLTVFASSVYKRQKKSIFLVLDDSGSMDYTRENDANYALQTLVAMTDKSDDVHIFFLNNNSSLSGNLNMAQKDNSKIASIKANYPKADGSTPYQYIKTAQQKIKDAASKGDETEYWLIVLTDGDFDEGQQFANEDLLYFAQEKLANDTNPNVMFISIGTNYPFNTNGLQQMHFIRGNNIIKAMDDASKIITGRVVADNVNYSQGNSKLSFSLPYPVKNIIILSQNIRANITDYTSTNVLNTSENYTVTHPNSKSVGETTVCFITEQNGKSIPAGNISFDFDKPINPQNTTVLFEPAIGLSAHYYNGDGQEITPDDIRVGDKIRLEYSLCDSETNQLIDESALGGNVGYSADINGSNYQGNNIEFEVDVDQVNLDLYATLPDGFVLDIHDFRDKLKKLRNVSLSLSSGGRFEAEYKDLKNAEGIDANVLLNGQPLTPDEFKDLTLKIKGNNPFRQRFSIEENALESKYTIHPKKGIFAALTPYSKTYKIELKDANGPTQFADLSVEIPGERPWISILILVISILALLYLIWVFATKTYFPKGTVFCFYTTGIPKRGHNVHMSTYTYPELFWNEFKSDPRIFFTHLLKQLLPHRSMCVTLYGNNAGDLLNHYSKITVYADSQEQLRVEDCSISRAQNRGYVSDYEVIAANFHNVISLKYMLDEGKSVPYRLKLNQSFRFTETVSNRKKQYYLQWVKKNKF